MPPTSEAETSYYFGAYEFTPDISRVRVAQSLDFCVVVCRSLFVVLPLYYTLLGLTASGDTLVSNISDEKIINKRTKKASLW